MNKHIKVLPMESFFDLAVFMATPLEDEDPVSEDIIMQLIREELIDDGMIEMEPIFNRNGWYYDRINNTCWHEWNGTAWKRNDEARDIESFKYRLNQLNAPVLEQPELAAIRILAVYGNLGSTIIRSFYPALHASGNRKMLRRIQIGGYKFKKRLKNDKLEGEGGCQNSE